MFRENFINYEQMNQIGKIEKSYSYTIPEGPHKGETLWSGRYCAVSCVVLAKEKDDKWYVLINKRGKGTPDDQGKWNMPCGYLDGGESATEACSREVAEECGVSIPSEAFALINVETDPKKCNKGNVTLRHLCILSLRKPIGKLQEGGEKDEVDGIKWLPIEEIPNYNWAFNHKSTLLNEIIPKLEEYYHNYVLDTIKVTYE